MSDIPKLNLLSRDIVADKHAQLKALFPEVFTEADQIDFDKLRLTLGDRVDTKEERFGLHWAGKKDCFNTIQAPSIATLKAAEVESVDWEETENLFIEGDNLEVLKLLQKPYYGKVKIIYIDPPYNTGKEFIYTDKYQVGVDAYLAYTEQANDNGYKFSTNTELEGRYHSNWLNMMYPRLFLARNLLQESGVIFISIDENELNNLLSMCNEIFGEENFIEIFSWIKSETPANLSTKTKKAVEYILCYQKARDNNKFVGLKKDSKSSNGLMNKTNPINKLIFPKDVVGTGLTDGIYKKGTYGTKSYHIILHEDTCVKNGLFVEKVILSGNFKWTQAKLEAEIEKGTTVSIRTASFSPSYEKREYEPEVPWNLISRKFDVSTNESAGKQLAALFDNKKLFDYPKPVSLIKYLIGFVARDKDIILDFFAGSCSTAEATLRWSIENDKQLKYIMVQLPEPTGKKTIAYEEGFKNIADLGKERIRRVVKKIAIEKQSFEEELQLKKVVVADLIDQQTKTSKSLGSAKSKKLADLEIEIEALKKKMAMIESADLGFKVFKLAQSNFKVWDGSVENDLSKQIEISINHLQPDSKELDILFELLLKMGFELTLPIQKLRLVDKKVYTIQNKALMICLEQELNEAVIRAIAAEHPARFVCLDAGFKGNDQLKANAVQIMKSHNVQDFKTV
ncbi:MAG: site-specific DNA-methyltransferase [Bacteroidota bacterium]